MNREEIWQGAQYTFHHGVHTVRALIEKEKSKRNKRRRVVCAAHTSSSTHRCEIFMRELDENGEIVRETPISGDLYNAHMGMDGIPGSSADRHGYSNSNYPSSTDYSDDGDLTELTPTTSRSSTPQPNNATASRYRNSETLYPRNRHVHEDPWAQHQNNFYAHTERFEDSAGPSYFNNGDDDLYDMPHEDIPLSKLKQLNLERQRSMNLSQLNGQSIHQPMPQPIRSASTSYTASSAASISSSQPEMEQISSPIAHMFYQSHSQSHLQSQLKSDHTPSQSVSSRSHSRTASECSSTNDFMEYERRLREDDDNFAFHRVNATIPSKKSKTAISDESNSTRSTSYPSLLFSPSDSGQSDGSWHRRAGGSISSMASELATPSESDVSTLDCESLIYQSDGEGSSTDRSNPRPRSHVH